MAVCAVGLTLLCSRTLNELCVWKAAGLCSSTNSMRSSTKARPTIGHFSQVGVWPAQTLRQQPDQHTRKRVQHGFSTKARATTGHFSQVGVWPAQTLPRQTAQHTRKGVQHGSSTKARATTGHSSQVGVWPAATSHNRQHHKKARTGQAVRVTNTARTVP
jgi:RNA:NAD 2'-phosphotransferase (TPT1/KptA family)